jgi:hypothetical protein
MRKNVIMTAAFAVAGLLAAVAVAQSSSAVSDAVSLDTRSLSAMTDDADQNLDTRSHTTGWSAARKLNTKKIRGTALLIR